MGRVGNLDKEEIWGQGWRDIIHGDPREIEVMYYLGIESCGVQNLTRVEGEELPSHCISYVSIEEKEWRVVLWCRCRNALQFERERVNMESDF